MTENSDSLAETLADLGETNIPPGFTTLIASGVFPRHLGVDIPILMVPQSVAIRIMTSGGRYTSPEQISIGLSESITAIRRDGPSLLLADSLIALSIATEHTEEPPYRIQLVLEALETLERKKADHRVGFAYAVLGEILAQMGMLNDALTAFERASASPASNVGTQIMTAYHTSSVCARLGLDHEARESLDRARELMISAKSLRGYESWDLIITVDYSRSLMALGDNSGALAAINDWLSRTEERHHAPVFLKAELEFLSGRRSVPVELYLEAAVLASKHVLSFATGRFRRAASISSDSIFAQVINRLADFDKPEFALGALEIYRRGAIPVTRSEEQARSFSDEETISLQREIERLVEISNRAFKSQDRRALQRCQSEAERIVSRFEMATKLPTPEVPLVGLIENWVGHIRNKFSARSGVVTFAAVLDLMYVFIVSAAGTVCRKLDVSPAQVELQAESVRQEIECRIPTIALEVLAEQVLGTVVAELSDLESIRIVPCSELQGVPFHAMGVLRNRSISYSVASIGFDLAEHSRPSFNANSRWIGLEVSQVGYDSVPDLPGASHEVERAFAVFENASSQLKRSANAEDLLQIRDHYDIVHVAAHGQFDPAFPLLSRLLFADRPLYAFEIALSEIRVQQVILSACDTAVARTDRGGYLQSLSAAFLHTGAETVIGALWPIADDVSSDMLTGYYRSLIGQQRTPADALARAQGEVRAGIHARHPYFWAPFMILEA